MFIKTITPWILLALSYKSLALPALAKGPEAVVDPTLAKRL